MTDLQRDRRPLWPIPAPVVRVVLYYAIVLPALLATLVLVPSIGRAMAVERQDTIQGFESGDVGIDPRGISADRTVDLQLVTAIAASLTGALLFAIPVAWVYQSTRRRKGYSAEMAQTILILPVAVATVVFLVKGSLALAFGLAGIVAAVRFRNTLDDTKDAVYLFVTIGIGLAAGAQLLTVAAVASVFFNALVLVVWWIDFGERPEPRPKTKPSQA